MSLTETSTGRPLRFSDTLERLGAHGGSKLFLGEIVEAFGERAFGAVMLLFAIVNMLPWPPGGTTLTGAPLLFLSAELAWGRDTLWMPRWLDRASVSRETFRKLSGRLMKVIRFTESLSRPRLYFLTGRLGQGLIGLACLVLSAILVLPVFGGNLIPAVAIGFFSLGVMQRDGLAVLLGWATTAIAVAVLIFAWNLVIAGFGAGLEWIERVL
ncbi:MAG: exopolysaccharide biosynthesis protein [Alphaproteobacteria bacterium]|nr:exopolysaccharide biosynthesis protein [Alphaproteobacteria bacterium]MBU2380011.1 exopolysaccharide biosynthesis protein [Alphaproteobacteria bacterium]